MGVITQIDECQNLLKGWLISAKGTEGGERGTQLIIRQRDRRRGKEEDRKWNEEHRKEDKEKRNGKSGTEIKLEMKKEMDIPRQRKTRERESVCV